MIGIAKFFVSQCIAIHAKRIMIRIAIFLFKNGSSYTPDEKIQVNPRLWPGLEILIEPWCSDPVVLTLCLTMVLMGVT